MEQIKVNPSNEKYYSSEFIKGFNCGAQRQFEADMADHKTESSSEKPNNCTDCECTDDCSECKEAEHGCKDEPTISKMEQVDKDINVRSKDEPQTERSSE